MYTFQYSVSELWKGSKAVQSIYCFHALAYVNVVQEHKIRGAAISKGSATVSVGEDAAGQEGYL